MIKQLRRGDNYSYVIYQDSPGPAVLVDPVAEQAVDDYLDRQQLEPRLLINTHSHSDHTSANRSFRQRWALSVAAHPDLDQTDRPLADGETIRLSNLGITIIHTPGHTPDSICLQGEDWLITGDTLFLAGCGNPLAGGNTGQLYETFSRKLINLPEQLRVYPGHDYAHKNLRFALSLEPDNQAARDKLQEVEQDSQQNIEPSSNLAEEKCYNPFFRFSTDCLKNQLPDLTGASDREIFLQLRAWRNRF